MGEIKSLVDRCQRWSSRGLLSAKDVLLSLRLRHRFGVWLGFPFLIPVGRIFTFQMSTFPICVLYSSLCLLNAALSSLSLCHSLFLWQIWSHFSLEQLGQNEPPRIKVWQEQQSLWMILCCFLSRSSVINQHWCCGGWWCGMSPAQQLLRRFPPPPACLHSGEN